MLSKSEKQEIVRLLRLCDLEELKILDRINKQVFIEKFNEAFNKDGLYTHTIETVNYVEEYLKE